MYWKEQEEPCNVCGQMTDVRNKGFCSTNCENKAWDDSYKAKDFPTFKEFVRGKQVQQFEPEFFKRQQVARAEAKQRMLDEAKQVQL